MLGVRVLVPDAEGKCPHFDRETRLCAVHHNHGQETLPGACFQFPRRALIDDRGTFITLSHYCPTAARLLLLDDGPLTVVEHPEAFPTTRSYEGLDARGSWAPLVRPDLLFDLDSYTLWERFVVASLASTEQTIGDSLSRIATAAEDLRRWTPREGSFADWTARLLDHYPNSGRPSSPGLGRVFSGTASSLGRYSDYTELEAFSRVTETVDCGLPVPTLPEDLALAYETLVAPGWNRFSGPVRRYLASKAFGSWSAYQSRGVRSLVAELYAAEMVLRVEAVRACQTVGRPLDSDRLLAAIRASDLLLIHLVDRHAFMKWIGRVENTCHPARTRQPHVA